jgi:intein-encoded DNA endonuclease-like protein
MNEKNIIEKYNNGHGTCELASEFNCHRSTIQKILKKNKIKLRKGSPRKNKYNVNFFKEYNVFSCYWAGFIAADGHIRYNRKSVDIHLMKSDIEHLKKIQECTLFTGKIETDKKSCRIVFSGEWFVKDLNDKYNITPRKSKTIMFPNQMPDHFVSHFVRGVVDGDGSISNNKLTINSGSKTFLQEIHRHIKMNCALKKRIDSKDIPISQAESGVYTLYYSEVNSKIILAWLYQDSVENNRLERKFMKYC